jgi:hypothetical protein
MIKNRLKTNGAQRLAGKIDLAISLITKKITNNNEELRLNF